MSKTESSSKKNAKKPEISYEDMVRLSCIEGLIDAQIADRYGISVQRVRYLRRKKYDITFKNEWQHAGKLLPQEVSPQDEARAVVTHLFEEFPLKEIAGEKKKTPAILLRQKSSEERLQEFVSNATKKLADLLAIKKGEPKAYKYFTMRYGKSYSKNWEDRRA